MISLERCTTCTFNGIELVFVSWIEMKWKYCLPVGNESTRILKLRSSIICLAFLVYINGKILDLLLGCIVESSSQHHCYHSMSLMISFSQQLKCQLKVPDLYLLVLSKLCIRVDTLKWQVRAKCSCRSFYFANLFKNTHRLAE